jgi:DNA-binding transcriptional MerR regulator
MNYEKGSWKLSGNDKEEMQRLRDQGYGYKSIAEIFDVDPNTVRYWLIQERQEVVKATSVIEAQNRTFQEKERRRLYMQHYFYERYHGDLIFREKWREYMKLYMRQRSKKNLNEFIGMEQDLPLVPILETQVL